MRLSLYLSRRFLAAFVMMLGIFFAFLFMIDMVEQLRKFTSAAVGLPQAAVLSLLNVPASLYSILPLIIVLAAIVMFLGLARNSELVVIRAAGRSGMAIVAAPMVVALALGGLGVAFVNPIVAATSKRVETLSESYRSGGSQTISIDREGVWLRQGGGDDENGDAGDATQAVIRAARANADATTLFDVTFLIFAPEKGPIRRISADKAVLGQGQWRLTGVKDWRLAASDNPERDALELPQLNLPSDLTPERIRDGFGKPSAIPFWELPDFINGLQRAGFSARRHQVWFQMELALPLMLAAMVLVAAGFTMRHSRMGGTGTMVLLALASGLAAYFLRNMAQVLGDNGQIPVALAAWMPPVVALLAAGALLLAREDG
ncbi:LPS export ABC transporter permease LptG [Phaeovulum sp. W22_SRMD_FR3]|uniref:LPS export ABC transporter permease LptG n=1 Tax=Phaeovulum sp. W22_SRMD_FR3 TaxID=3240274 RepID=UPI003F97DB4D